MAMYKTRGTIDYIQLGLSGGPTQVPSKGGRSWYKLTFIDKLSKNIWTKFLKNRQVFATFKQWKNLAGKQT